MTSDKEIKQVEEYQKFLEYKGEDRVILAEELLKEVSTGTKVSFNSGFRGLDDIVGGFRRGQLVVISAATGQGKTSLAQALTEKFLLEGHKSLWFSYEVGIEEFMEKMPEGGKMFYVPRVLRQGILNWVENRIKESIAKYGTRIVFIDHLHYLLEMQKMAEAKSLSLLIGMMLRDLKRLCIDQNITIFLISHMKKIDLAEKPELSDLRDSSFVAQESDLVIMMWRIRKQGLFKGEWEETNEARVSVKKNRRTGKLGTISLFYENGKFSEFGVPTHEIKVDEINF